MTSAQAMPPYGCPDGEVLKRVAKYPPAPRTAIQSCENPVDAGLGVLAVSFIFTDRPVSSSPETPDTMTMSDCLRAPREDFQG